MAQKLQSGPQGSLASQGQAGQGQGQESPVHQVPGSESGSPAVPREAAYVRV